MILTIDTTDMILKMIVQTKYWYWLCRQDTDNDTLENILMIPQIIRCWHWFNKLDTDKDKTDKILYHQRHLNYNTVGDKTKFTEWPWLKTTSVLSSWIVNMMGHNISLWHVVKWTFYTSQLLCNLPVINTRKAKHILNFLEKQSRYNTYHVSYPILYSIYKM